MQTYIIRLFIFCAHSELTPQRLIANCGIGIPHLPIILVIFVFGLFYSQKSAIQFMFNPMRLTPQFMFNPTKLTPQPTRCGTHPQIVHH